MRKFLSILLAFVLCVSVIFVDPPIESGDGILDPPKNEQGEEDGGAASPCDDDPGSKSDIPG